MGIAKYQYIDPSRLLAALEGDWNAVASLVKTFLGSAPEIFARLERGADAGNARAVWHESHALKGMVALLDAGEFSTLLLKTEQAARNGKLPSDAERNELAANFSNLMGELLHCVQNATKV
jgi:HPt (histidine-containing phosphotransfer) domain-containing protein